MILNMKPPPGETPRELPSPEEEHVIKSTAFMLKPVLGVVFVAAILSAVMELWG